MRLDGVALVGFATDQEELPKGIHPRQVLRPIYLGDVIEDVTDDIILPHFCVEGIDQQFDVVLCSNIIHVMGSVQPGVFSLQSTVSSLQYSVFSLLCNYDENNVH